MKVGIRDKEGYLITFDSPEEAAEVGAAFAEMRWHLGNLLAMLEAVKDNHRLTAIYCYAAQEILYSYKDSIQVPQRIIASGMAEEHPYQRPNFRHEVELCVHDVFGIDHAADILPRHTVRGAATGNGTFELGAGGKLSPAQTEPQPGLAVHVLDGAQP